jgi:PAS domain S-box-containing protein
MHLGMDSRDRSVWLGYSVSLISTALTVLAKLLLVQVAGPLAPFILSLVPVIISAWYGGLWCGILATVLIAAADTLYFLPLAEAYMWRFRGALLVSVSFLEGVVISILSAARDRARSQRRRSEEALRNWEYVINHAGWGIVLVDPVDHRMRTVNPAFAAMHGYAVEELTGRSLAETFAPESRAEFEHHAGLAQEASHDVYESVHVRKDGGTFPVLTDVTVLKDADGKVLFRAVYCQDITERKRFEQKLREGQKLESLGVLAGGLAHDFNNLLTGIMGNAGLALDSLPKSAPERSNLSDVMRASESAAHLTRQMLAYSGKGRLVVRPLNLSAVVREITPLIHTSISKNVRLELDLRDDIPQVRADASQMQQLIMNLVINGAEAIGEGGGTVKVTTRAEEIEEGQTREFPDNRPGAYTCLEVSDTGCGMDEETKSKIFDPFFSTKFTGRGLGLAAVSGIVRGHHGAFSVRSAPGKGSTFRVVLPVCEDKVRLAASGSDAMRDLCGSGTILVVDDEEIVRCTAKSVLERCGYRVLLAENGLEGMEQFRAMSSEIALVLIDMTMPVMSGEEALRLLKAMRKDLRVIASSGYSEAEAMERFGGNGVAAFLEKPYTPVLLARKVKKVMDSA